MSLEHGPIFGQWPVDRIETAETLLWGDKVVLDNGILRKAHEGERYMVLPEGAVITGSHLHVPDWWWAMHFAENLTTPYPLERCCGDGVGYMPNREQCGDCPL